VLSVDIVENLWKRTCKERPQNLNQLRAMEVAFATQAKLYELGKYEAPGSRDDEIATNYASVKSASKDQGLMAQLNQQ
jgi:hypothetical protein